MSFTVCRDAFSDTVVVRPDMASLPPPSDIPDSAVKGRGGLLERKGHFSTHIHNVFLTLCKPSLITSHIRPYLDLGSRKRQLVWLLSQPRTAGVVCLKTREVDLSAERVSKQVRV